MEYKCQNGECVECSVLHMLCKNIYWKLGKKNINMINSERICENLVMMMQARVLWGIKGSYLVGVM